MWENYILATAGAAGKSPAEETSSIWESILDLAPGLITQWAPKIGGALLLLFVFWLASRIARKMLLAAGEKAKLIITWYA